MGDSITEGWYQDPFSRSRPSDPRPKYKELLHKTFGKDVSIFALGGDRVQELGWRLQNGGYEKLRNCKPEKIYIMISTNDIT
eukprot:UN15987